MPADEGLVLVILGTLCVYSEFIWPGRVWPAVGGALLAIAGLYGLAQVELTCGGVVLAGIAVILFVVEALFWRVNLMAGTAGTIALSVCGCLLVRHPASLSPLIILPVMLVFGCLTTVLCWEAKRARRNKWADLSDRGPAGKQISRTSSWNFPPSKP